MIVFSVFTYYFFFLYGLADKAYYRFSLAILFNAKFRKRLKRKIFTRSFYRQKYGTEISQDCFIYRQYKTLHNMMGYYCLREP